jgi:hypothetical protein
MLTLCRAIYDDDRGDLTTHAKLAEASGIKEETISRWLSQDDQLSHCLEKKDGHYRLTAIG